MSAFAISFGLNSASSFWRIAVALSNLPLTRMTEITSRSQKRCPKKERVDTYIQERAHKIQRNLILLRSPVLCIPNKTCIVSKEYSIINIRAEQSGTKRFARIRMHVEVLLFATFCTHVDTHTHQKADTIPRICCAAISTRHEEQNDLTRQYDQLSTRNRLHESHNMTLKQ